MSGFNWDWGFAARILPVLLEGLAVTIESVMLGMVVALVIGLVFAVLRRARSPFVRYPVGAFVEFVRSTPLLVQLFLLYVLLPGSFSALLSGVIALGLHYGTYTSEVYRAGIEDVPRGQWEAAKALDLSRFSTYRHVVLPQAIPPVIPALGNYLIAMFKDSPMLLAIQVMEVLNTAMQIGSESFNYIVPITMVGAMYLLLSLLSEVLISRLEVRFMRYRVR